MSGLIGTLLQLLNRTEAPKRTGDLVWYIAYGSNLNEAVFVQRRKIMPVQSVNVTIPDYVFTFSMDAVPYLEPCFATLRHRSEHKAFDSYPDAQAVAYQIRESEYMRILATEGGHGYNDLGHYSSELINVSAYDGTQIEGFALLGGYCRTSVDASMKNKPSKRYRDIVIEGAKKSGLRPEYIKFLEQFDAYSPPQDRWGRLAKYLVLLLVLPSLLSILVGVPFLLSLGFERPPYYYAWVMSNYSRLVLGFAYPALLMVFGPGMY